MTWPFTLIFGLALLGFLVASLILVYHWHRFARDSRVAAIFEVLYFVVGMAVLLVALGALLILIAQP
jgi:Ni/Fe-hydrogenase subunit HybB-like protein